MALIISGCVQHMRFRWTKELRKMYLDEKGFAGTVLTGREVTAALTPTKQRRLTLSLKPPRLIDRPAPSF